MKYNTKLAVALSWALPLSVVVILAMVAFDAACFGAAAWLVGAAFGWVVSGEGIAAGNRFGGAVALLTAGVSLFIRLGVWLNKLSAKLTEMRIAHAEREAEK